MGSVDQKICARKPLAFCISQQRSLKLLSRSSLFQSFILSRQQVWRCIIVNSIVHCTFRSQLFVTLWCSSKGLAIPLVNKWGIVLILVAIFFIPIIPLASLDQKKLGQRNYSILVTIIAAIISASLLTPSFTLKARVQGFTISISDKEITISVSIAIRLLRGVVIQSPSSCLARRQWFSIVLFLVCQITLAMPLRSQQGTTKKGSGQPR